MTTDPAPRTTPSATEAILARLAREDLRRSIEQLYALGWRLTTAGGDTVDHLAVIHMETRERVEIWTSLERSKTR